jgi:hypothetical protein
MSARFDERSTLTVRRCVSCGFPTQELAEVQAGWEQAGEALAALCERCDGGSWLARALQTALVLLRLGLEGAGPGAVRNQLDNLSGGCRQPVQLPEDRGVLKLINRLAPLCVKNSQQSICRLQQLVDGGCTKSTEEIEKLAAVMFMCTRFVVDACECVILNPEDWDIARCTSLHRMLPLMECCLPTLDSALVLSSVARKLQGTAEAQDLVEPLLGTYQTAMGCLQGLCTWLAQDFLSGLSTQLQSLASRPNPQMLTERQAFSRVLSLVASLAKSHTVDLRPGIINIAYKSLIKVLNAAVPLLPEKGFWIAGFDGQELAASMLTAVERAVEDLFLFSPGVYPYPEPSKPRASINCASSSDFANVAGDDGAKQIKLIRFMLGNLTSLLRLAPQSLVAKDVLPGSLALFAQMKALVPPCHSSLRAHQDLAPSIRQELKKHVSPLLDALLHSLLTSDLMQPGARLLLIQCLCSTSKEPAPPLGTRVMPAEDSAAREWAEMCNDAAGRLVLVQSALHNIGTHPEDVQQGFVQRLPDIFRLLQVAAPHCLTVPCTDNMTAEPQEEEEEEADLLFRCSVMLGALLSVVPGTLRAEAQRVIVAQVCACTPLRPRARGRGRSDPDMTACRP